MCFERIFCSNYHKRMCEFVFKYVLSVCDCGRLFNYISHYVSLYLFGEILSVCPCIFSLLCLLAPICGFFLSLARSVSQMWQRRAGSKNNAPAWRMMNHHKILINPVQSRWRIQKNKVFVLHFPPENNFKIKWKKILCSLWCEYISYCPPLLLTHTSHHFPELRQKEIIKIVFLLLVWWPIPFPPLWFIPSSVRFPPTCLCGRCCWQPPPPAPPPRWGQTTRSPPLECAGGDRPLNS